MEDKHTEIANKWIEVRERLKNIDQDGLPNLAEVNRLINELEEAKRNAPELCSTRRNSVFKRLDSK